MLMMLKHQHHRGSYSPFVGSPVPLVLSFNPKYSWPGQALRLESELMTCSRGSGAPKSFTNPSSLKSAGVQLKLLLGWQKWTPNCADEAPVCARGSPASIISTIGGIFRYSNDLLVTLTYC